MSFDLAPGDDLRQILVAAQAMLANHYPVARLRAQDNVDAIEPLAEFGTFLLALPEDAGGGGFSVVEEAHLHVAFGRHIMGIEVIATAVAVRLALETGRGDLAAAIASGDIRICGGVSNESGCLLFEPEAAELALVRTPDGVNLVSLKGSKLTPVTSMGHGRPLARLEPGPVVTNDMTAGRTTELLMAMLISAHLLGAATAACDLAVDYAGTREQFGRPIGSFQAVKHHCANMLIGVEMVSAQLDMAAIALRDRRDDAAFQVAALARLAPDIALRNARLTIQIHGGIGFSAEADAHLFLKQAHSLRNFLPVLDFISLEAPMAPLRKATR